MNITITEFTFDGPDDPIEDRCFLRQFKPETIRRRAEKMLGDRVGCVAVYENNHQVLSLVRREEGEEPREEDMAVIWGEEA